MKKKQVGRLKKIKHKRKEVGVRGKTVGEREKERKDREGLRRAVQMGPGTKKNSCP